jgi:hypothetical protein
MTEPAATAFSVFARKSSQALEYEFALKRGIQAVAWGVPVARM